MKALNVQTQKQQHWGGGQLNALIKKKSVIQLSQLNVNFFFLMVIYNKK